MKKFVFVILLGFFATRVFCQSDYTICWQTTSIRIDGKTADWGGRPRYYDNKTKLAFDIRNDSNNIYMVFQIPDQITQFKFARAGMCLYFTTKLKPKIKAVIVFPPFMTPRSGMQGRNSGEQGEQKDPTVLKQKYLLSPPSVLTSGFAFSNGIISSLPAINALIYAIGWDTTNKLDIELKIPLRELFGDNFDFGKITQKDISMKLEENAVESTGNSSGGPSPGSAHGGAGGGGMGGHGGGMGHQGGGGSGGGGMHHGGGNRSGEGNSGENKYGSGESQDRAALYESATLKQNFKLNSKNK